MVTQELTVTLKPSNKPLVQGCPGVPKTYPAIVGTLEVRSTSIIPQQVDSVTIVFATVDTLRSKPRDVPGMLRKVNYEMTIPVNDRIIAMDVPFLIGIRTDICPTSEGSRGTTTHRLEVNVNSGKQSREYLFPVVISTYDTLPLYRQFNEPISKVVDSRDNAVMVDYSLPTSAIGPHEELVVNFKLSTNPVYPKLADKVKLKKITMEIVEVFDCRCDKSFIKESTLVSSIKDYGNTYLGVRGLTESLTISQKPSENDKYRLFLKHQDPKLLRTNASVNNNSSSSSNELRPLIIDYNEDTIPLTHHQPMTKRSILFSTYYELRLFFKLSGAKDVEVKQPITIAPFDRTKSIYLLKWIIKESEMAEIFLQGIEKELGKISYDSKFDTLVYPQRKPSKMKSKEDKESFV
ncbi:Arrestin family protein 1 [Cyberlindnera fabianii]|uniref:Arrestin family protein 1 n=1 Tax=Cyberlindnera fabianii TaxID=36022 RepID=A0A1V2L4K3_CYBFA|nr:Arrestin family protein 1 [Cyberlindnera fabianii]